MFLPIMRNKIRIIFLISLLILDAEIRALSYAKEHRFDLIVMRPSMMLGPGDIRLRSTSTVLSFLHRKLPFTPCGGVSFVDIRDAAEAFKTAMEKGTCHFVKISVRT